MVGLRLNEAKSELEPVQDIQFLGLPLLLDQGRASLQSLGDMAHVVPNIFPENLVIQRSVPIFGITQLGLRSHPTGSSTLSFIRSDKQVFNTVAFRPCYPTQAVAEPIVSHIRNPYLTFPGGVHHFHGRLDPGRGRPHGDSQIAGVWTRSERELHINVLELRAVILALHHWATVLQGRHVLIATDNTTVVAYRRCMFFT